MTEMKCVIRDNLEKMGISIRRLAEQAESVSGAPSYSTIDNFIRKGTGHLDTAWAITKLMGLTLNDNFVCGDSELPVDQTAQANAVEAETALKSIIAAIHKVGKIEKPAQIAEILFAVGKEIAPLGYDDEAGNIINMGTDFITMLNTQGGNGDE